MTEPFIFINTYDVDRRQFDTYRERFRRTAQYVEVNEPRMLYFACHVSEDDERVSTVQVHADAANMARHLELARQHIESARQVLDFSTMSVQIFGSPSEEVVAHIHELIGAGVDVRVAPAVVAFDRFHDV